MVTNPPPRPPRRRNWVDKVLEAIKRFIERARDKSRDHINPAEEAEKEPERPAPPPPPPSPTYRSPLIPRGVIGRRIRPRRNSHE